MASRVGSDITMLDITKGNKPCQIRMTSEGKNTNIK